MFRVDYFYPRSPCGERHRPVNIQGPTTKFLSTLSLRRATAKNTSIAGRITSFLSTLSLRRATPTKRRGNVLKLYFYPRSPCGERRLLFQNHIFFHLFLSTLSLRRATSTVDSSSVCSSNFYPRSPCGERRPHSINYMIHTHFYPRSPCGERRIVVRIYPHSRAISIHALLAESDLEQSSSYNAYLEISIHALLAESDCPVPTAPPLPANFYPRSPCGERLVPLLIVPKLITFLSTLSLRRATTVLELQCILGGFLSTLSLRRATALDDIKKG